MNQEFPKYVVTDFRSIVERLDPIVLRLGIQFLNLKEFIQSEHILNSIGFLNVVFYLSASRLKETQREVHERFQKIR